MDIANKIPASIPITAIIIIIVDLELLISGADFSIYANIPIRIPSAAVAPASLDGSINDNATTDTAITPIAIAIAIMDPFTSLAPFVA